MCPMQGGGEDYQYLSIQIELGKLMSLLLKILFTCDEAIKSLSVGLEAYLMLQGWKNREEHVRNLCKYWFLLIMLSKFFFLTAQYGDDLPDGALC